MSIQVHVWCLKNIWKWMKPNIVETGVRRFQKLLPHKTNTTPLQINFFPLPPPPQPHPLLIYLSGPLSLAIPFFIFRIVINIVMLILILLLLLLFIIDLYYCFNNKITLIIATTAIATFENRCYSVGVLPTFY